MLYNAKQNILLMVLIFGGEDKTVYARNRHQSRKIAIEPAVESTRISENSLLGANQIPESLDDSSDFFFDDMENSNESNQFLSLPNADEYATCPSFTSLIQRKNFLMLSSFIDEANFIDLDDPHYGFGHNFDITRVHVPYYAIPVFDADDEKMYLESMQSMSTVNKGKAKMGIDDEDLDQLMSGLKGKSSFKDKYPNRQLTCKVQKKHVEVLKATILSDSNIMSHREWKNLNLMRSRRQMDQRRARGLMAKVMKSREQRKAMIHFLFSCESDPFADTQQVFPSTKDICRILQEERHFISNYLSSVRSRRYPNLEGNMLKDKQLKQLGLRHVNALTECGLAMS